MKRWRLIKRLKLVMERYEELIEEQQYKDWYWHGQYQQWMWSANIY